MFKLIHKHVKYGLGIRNTNKGFEYFCMDYMRGPYSDDSKTKDTVDCLSRIVENLYDRDVYFVYTPPRYIIGGSINCIPQTSFIFQIENTNCSTIEDIKPYYTNYGRHNQKQYLEYLPCIYIYENFTYDHLQMDITPLLI